MALFIWVLQAVCQQTMVPNMTASWGVEEVALRVMLPRFAEGLLPIFERVWQTPTFAFGMLAA